MIETPWLTVQEAATYARIGHSRIYEACRGGGVIATRTHTPKGTWISHRDRLDECISDGLNPARMRPPRNRRGT